MTQIGPDHHKQEEIGSYKGRVNVIERFRGSQEEITDIMSDIYCESHIRKMEPVAQPNQAERYAMMRYQLFEVLSRLF